MSVTQKLVTSKFNVETAKQFVNGVVNGDSAYYVYTANHVPYTPDDSYIAVPNNSVQSTVYEPYNNMIFGKKITAADVNIMVKRNEWVSGTVYDMYDHTKDLATLSFYVFVQTGTIWNLYKCLSNGYGAASTVAPTGQSLQPILSPVDGYVWKYMGTTSDAIYRKFNTNYYAPFTPNTSVITGATPGTIEFIRVNDRGRGYNNWYTGTFRYQDLNLAGTITPTVFGLPEDANPITGYYEGCIIKMKSGAASGQARRIVKYQYLNNQRQIYLESAFNGTILQGDQYEIYPGVYIFGDGTETVNCVARAVVNTASTSGNTISYVEVITPGAGYRYADTVIVSKPVVGVTANSSLTALISPPGGHGSDPYNELVATQACVSVAFQGDEGTYIPATNDYRQVGIIKDPLFGGVTLTLDITKQLGAFVVGENIYQYRPIPLAGQISTTATSTTITGINTYFSSSLVPGDYVFFTSGSANYFGKVSSVASNTSLTLATAVPFTASAMQIALANTTGLGTVTAVATGSINVTNVDTRTASATIQTIISDKTMTSSFVTGLQINGKALNGLFNTFVELNTFTGTQSSGAFLDDEYVTQPNALVVANLSDTANVYNTVVSGYQPSARVHTSNSTIMYVSNVKRVFNNGNTVTGVSSSAQFGLAYKYLGDLVRDSGEIIYMENIDPITRQSNKNETIKIVLQF
jgi:hypothetical protein